MDELLTMSKTELTRLEIMKRLEEKRHKQKEAAEMLGITERHIRRLLRAYREQGERGLISKRRGKPSNNRLKAEIRQRAIDLLHSRYMEVEKSKVQSCSPTASPESLSGRIGAD